MFKRICGYVSVHPRPVHDYWTTLSVEERYLKGNFKYSSTEFYEVLHKRFQEAKKNKENKLQEDLKEKELKDKETIEKNRIKRIKEKDKSDKNIDILAKPKDKWKTGKVLLKIQKSFKYDNILNKMIKTEFQDNKVFK